MSDCDTCEGCEGGSCKTPEALAEETKNKLDNMKCGYVVGLSQNGDFVFEVLGEQVGLVELMGLHTYADHRLHVALEINQSYGVPLLAGMLENTQKMLKVLLDMQTQKAANNLKGLIKG